MLLTSLYSKEYPSAVWYILHSLEHAQYKKLSLESMNFVTRSDINYEQLFVFQPSLASSVARPIVDGKSRTEAAAELSKDKVSRERWGFLLSLGRGGGRGGISCFILTLCSVSNFTVIFFEKMNQCFLHLLWHQGSKYSKSNKYECLLP